MTHKKVNRNARKALNEFKYEMAGELGVNDFAKNTKTKNKNKKLNEATEQQMGNTYKY